MRSCLLAKMQKREKDFTLKKKLRYLILERNSEKNIFKYNKTKSILNRRNTPYNIKNKYDNKIIEKTNYNNKINNSKLIKLLKIFNKKINNIFKNYITNTNSNEKNNIDKLGKYSKDSSNHDSYIINNYSTKVYDKGKTIQTQNNSMNKTKSKKKINLSASNSHILSYHKTNLKKNIEKHNYSSCIGRNLIKIKKITNKYIKYIKTTTNTTTTNTTTNKNNNNNNNKINYDEKNKKNIKQQILKKKN